MSVSQENKVEVNIQKLCGSSNQVNPPDSSQMDAMGMDTWLTKMNLKVKGMNFKSKENVLRKLIFPKLKEFYKLRVNIMHIFAIV